MSQTNWYVITGAPSSGKTTIINELRKRNFQVAHEVARAYICSLVDKSHPVHSIPRHTLDIQQKILDLKSKREQKLNPEEIIFFDRGIPDSIAYYLYHGLDPEEVIQACQHNRYKKIFYLEGLPIEADGVRVENEQAAQELGELIQQSYLSLGYEILKVPAVSVEERTELLLKEL